MRGIPDLVRTLHEVLPMWLFVPLLLVLAVWAAPAWLYSVRLKQIKNRARWLVGKRGAEREAILTEMFARADGDPRKLVAVAEECLRLDQRDAFRRALAELEARGGDPRDIARLQAATRADRPTFKHPLEAAVSIGRLIDAGLVAEAATRLTEARSRFGDDPELAGLEDRLSAATHP